MKRYRILIITIFSSMIMALFIVIMMGKKINNILYRYANIEINRLTNNVVLYHTKKIIETKDLDGIFKVIKNDNNEIEVIDFNTKKINNILSDISDKITKRLVQMEEGNIKDIDLPYTLRGTHFISLKKGIVCEIPMGVLLGSDILVNLGSNIPIKLVYSGKANTYVDTSIKEYGINNAYISVDIIIEISGRIVMPTTSKETKIKSKIPLLIRIINGKIPDFYQKTGI